MSSRVPTNVRVLNLFFDVLSSERGRTRSQLRTLPGYAELSEATFDVQFQRDKDALRETGVVLDVTSTTRGEVYTVADESFATSLERLEEIDISLIHMAVGVWRGADARTLGPKLAAASTASVHPSSAPVALDLEGADLVADLAEAISARRLVAFTYAALADTAERAVEPWRLVLRGRGLYLWGRDLDREGERLYRLSRIRSAVEFLGEPGDAGPVPDRLHDPFEDLMVAPELLIRAGRASRLRAHAEVVEEEGRQPQGRVDTVNLDGWERARGEEAELGEWLSLILTDMEDVVVVAPPSLRYEVLKRLRLAASWMPGGEDHA